MEHGPSVSGDLNKEEHVKDIDYPDHSGGLCTLEADRQEGAGNRRGGRNDAGGCGNQTVQQQDGKGF